MQGNPQCLNYREIQEQEALELARQKFKAQEEMNRQQEKEKASAMKQRERMKEQERRRREAVRSTKLLPQPLFNVYRNYYW